MTRETGHFIVAFPGDNYLYHRRVRGRMYEARAMMGQDFDQARVFTTRAAATRAGQEISDTFSVCKVALSMLEAPEF